MKLEKFDKNKKRKIIVTSVILGLFLIIGGVYLFRTFALYEEHKTFDVIQGKVPAFTKKEKDLEVAMIINGESSTEAPTDKDYRVTIECDTDAEGVWDYSSWSATISKVKEATVCTIKFDSIYNITVNGESRNTFPEKGDYQVNMTCSNVTNSSWNSDAWAPTVEGVNENSSCDVAFETITEVSIYDNAEVGDYVAYTPSKTSYEISGESTGYGSKQEINPSELNLWRVIKKNSDGTIEIVSEYASSNDIYFYGKEGYRRLVGTLNEMASAYETEGITSGSRHVGGTDEQATCSAYDACSDQKTSYTEDTPDTSLIKEAMGTLVAYQPNTTTAKTFWLASRYVDGVQLTGRSVAEGNLSYGYLTYGNDSDRENYGAIRPIITLKSGLTVAEGTKDGKKLWTVN